MASVLRVEGLRFVIWHLVRSLHLPGEQRCCSSLEYDEAGECLGLTCSHSSVPSLGIRQMGLLHAAAEKKTTKGRLWSITYHILGITCRKADPCRNIWPDFA